MNLNYIGHNQWNGQDFPNFYNRVISKPWDKIILFCQNEWEWHMHDPVYFPKLLNHCKKIKQPLHIITGSHHHLYPVQLENTIIHWWDTYWLGKTYSALIDTKLAKTIDPYNSVFYKYHFVCMNNRSHRHRALLIDLLAKNNLIEKNAISVHQDSTMYKWKYFSYRQILLEPEFANDRQQHRIPKQYYQSFAQLISESSGDTIMLSEKTATPLIIGKPFLIAGQMHFHKFLSELGFELYTEIFDYSFMTSLEEPKDESEPIRPKKFKLPFWALGIGLIFPPAWPFLIVGLLISYPKTTAVIAGSSVAVVFGAGTMINIEEKKAQEQADKESATLLNCRAKYKDLASVPSSDNKCLTLITRSNKEIAEAKERKALEKRLEDETKEREEVEARENAESMANSTAELACRRAVKEAQPTTDGYNIPLGSVITGRRSGHEGQYVTKFPYSVKNAFGVKMKHAVECVATSNGDIILINQLY